MVSVTVASPRTGIRYTFANPNQRPIVLQTAAIAPANAANGESYCGFKSSFICSKSRTVRNRPYWVTAAATAIIQIKS